MKSCQHLPECPGCPHFESSFSNWKANRLEAIGKTLRNYEAPLPSTIYPSPKREAIRNRCRWVVGTPKQPLGFYKKGTKKFVDIRACLMHVDPIEEASNHIRAFLKRQPKACDVFNFIDMRFDGQEVFVTFCTHHTTPEEATILLSEFTKIDNLWLNFNPKSPSAIMSGTQHRLSGKESLTWKVGKQTFRAAPQSFFQVNPDVLEIMHGYIAHYLKDHPFDSIYDFYCGIGIHSLSLVEQDKSEEKEIIGFDSSPSAIENAKENASEFSKVAKTHFYLSRDRNEELLSPPSNCLAILNPTRAGLSGRMIPFLSNSNFKHLIYISCNPETLYRDAERLAPLGYTFVSADGFEMMPRTSHVEIIAFFERAEAPKYDQVFAFWPPSRALSAGISGPVRFKKNAESFWIGKAKGAVPKGRPPGGKEIDVKILRRVGKDSVIAIRSKGVSDKEIIEAFQRWKHPILGKVNSKSMTYDRPMLHCIKSGEEESPLPAYIISACQLPRKVLMKNQFSS